jgi:hypothetical protein
MDVAWYLLNKINGKLLIYQNTTLIHQQRIGIKKTSF